MYGIQLHDGQKDISNQREYYYLLPENLRYKPDIPI